MVLFALVYFTSAYNEVGTSPWETLLWSVGIFVGFFMATRAHIGFVMAALGLSVTIFVAHRVRNWYVAKTEAEDFDVADLPEIRSVVDNVFYFEIAALVVVGILLVVGFGLYFAKQKTAYGDDFSVVNFLFGPPLQKTEWTSDVCSTSARWTGEQINDDSPAVVRAPTSTPSRARLSEVTPQKLFASE